MSTGTILGAGSVLSNAITDPSTIAVKNDGDRYIIPAGAVSPWNAFIDYIARWDGSTMMWDYDFPTFGLQQYVVSATKVVEWRSPDGTASPGWETAPSVRSSSFPFLTLAELDAAAVAMVVPLEFDATDSRLSLSSGTTTLMAPLARFTGGVFSLSSSATLTLQAIDAGELQCFDVSGTADVTIVSGTSVNARWFGATGNGTTNDAPALQAAIDCALNFTPLGGELYVPPGNYLIDAPLNATPFSIVQGFALRGAGNRSSIFTSGLTAGGTMLFIGSQSGQKHDGISIVDMGFQSLFNGGSTGENILVNLNFCRDVIVDRCAFIGGGGIQLFVGAPQGPQISNCDFFGLSWTMSGIVFGSSTDGHGGQAGRINNCIIRDFRVPAARVIGTIPMAIGTAIAMNFEAGSGSEYAIADCDIEDNDCSINCDVGRQQIARNSMESGVIGYFTYYNSGNASVPNVGNGVLSPDLLVPVGDTAAVGAYKVQCTFVSAPNATFTVYNPSGGTVSTLVVVPGGSSFANEIYFTIVPGTVPFAVNDSFTVWVLNASAASQTFSGTGTGVLTLSATPVIATAQLGSYLVTCTDAVSSPQVFTVTDPYGTWLGTYNVGDPAFQNQIMFTIAAGGVPFSPGATFTIAVSSLATFSDTAYSPSVAANPGVPNSGGGSLTGVGLSSMSGVTQSGVYTVVCTSLTGGGTFTVYDPQGQQVGLPVAVGTGFNNEVAFTVVASGAPFALGDSFQIDMLGDVLIKIGRNVGVASVYCVENTMSGDGIMNQRFFDLYDYREIYIDRNLFISFTGDNIGQAVRLGAEYNGRASYLRWNDGSFDPRTNITFDPLLPDGVWVIYGNSEGGSGTPGADVLAVNSATPSVANLATAYTENTATTTITDFSRGYTGQSLSVFRSSGPVAVLESGGNIAMLSGVNEPVLAGVNYEFRASLPPGAAAPVWQQIGPTVPSRTLDSDTAAYLAAGIAAGAPPLPPVMQNAIDDLVIALKAASLWTSMFDGFYLFAVNDWNLAKINLVKPTGTGSYPLTAMGTLDFQPYYGVSSSSSSYAATGMTMNMLTNYTINSGALTVWPSLYANEISYAIGTTAGGVARMNPYRGIGRIQGNVNDNGAIFSSGGSAVLGLSSLMRTGSAARNAYRNGASIWSDTQAENSFGSDTFCILKDGTTFHTPPIAMAGIGASRTGAQEVALYNAMLPYMQKLGLV